MISSPRIKALLYLCILLLLCCSVFPGFGQVTAPEDYLGYKPGADFHLATYEQWLGYLEQLAEETDRMQIFDMGSTSEGRRMKYAIISSEENMAKLEYYKEITRKLSLAKGVSEEEAERLADEGKAVVWIDAGMHSTEVAPPLQQLQLAYELVTGSDRRTRFIRDNVILLLVQANPDGMTIVADWYMKNLGTPYEVSRLPVLYHKYAGHDNNRDFVISNLLETQNINRVVAREWFPEVFYVQHQSAPFPARIWIPPNPEPVNPNQHPLIQRVKNLLGAALGQRFDEADQPGAISRTAFDLWYVGYADGPSVEGHNIPSILTETALYRYATPHYYTINDFPESYRDLTMGTFYPSPWQGGWWRLGDAVDYTLTASKAFLDVTAKYRYEFLYYKYKMARDVMERFNNEPPYGWIISANQRDANSTVLLINRLIDYGIEVYKANERFVHEGISYPKGSYIIPTSQPFGMYAKNVLEKQSYPDLREYGHLWQGVSRTGKSDGSPMAPYDGVGWTISTQMGIDAHEMSTPLKINSTLLSEADRPVGTLTGGGSHYVFSPTDNNSFKALNHIFEAGGKVSRSLDEFTLGGTRYPKGAFLVNSGTISAKTLNKIASETGILIRGGKVSVKLKSLNKPRIALYKSWVANMDAGWISFIFEQYAFPFHFLSDAEVRAGNLIDRFDVIILSDQRVSSIINGHRKGTMPPNYVGGITSDGVENLKEFVDNSGVMICNNSSSDLPINEFNLPVRNILQKIPTDSFNCPGSLLKISYDSSHSLTFGMQEKGMAYFSRGRVFEIVADTVAAKNNSSNQSPKIAASYPDESLLISGWMIGEKVIQKKAAILDVPYGKGKVILFGFNVHNRAQAFSTFKLLFNAIFYR